MVNEAGEEGVRNRVEAARLLGELPDCFDPLLSRLLADSDTRVVCEAIHSVGMLRKRRLVPELLDRLADHRLAPAAAQALGRFGDSIVGGLRDHLCDSAVPIYALIELPTPLLTLVTYPRATVLLRAAAGGDTPVPFPT